MKKYIIFILLFLLFGFPVLKAETINREKFEKAFQEVSYSYYMRGKNIQYNSMKTNADDSLYAPEEATSQNINYSVCAAYSYYTYFELLGVKIPHHTANLIEYARNYIGDSSEGRVGKSSVVAYGKKDSSNNLVMKFYKDGEPYNYITITNPTIDQILPYLKIGDVLTYSGHTIMIYDLKIENGNITNSYTIESGHGNGSYRANIKTNYESNHYLYHNSRSPLTYSFINQDILEGSLHIATIRYVSVWKDLDGQPNSNYKNEYTIVRFIKDINNKAVLDYEDSNENGTNIELPDKTEDRLKYNRLYIEKTVDKHNNNVVNVGDTLKYSIVIKNNNSSAYTDDLIVTEDISDYVTYNGVYSISKSNAVYNYSNNKITINIGKLNSGEMVTITYDVLVKSNTYGKEIVSKGKVGNISSSEVRNTIGHSLSSDQTSSIISKYNSTIDNSDYSLTGTSYIDDIYNSIGIDLDFDTFNIEDLVKNTGRTSLKYDTIKLNENHPLYGAVLNKYYNTLATWQDSQETKYDLKYWREYADSDRREDTIYKETLKTGDILVYKNTNDNTTNENGEYAYIYINGVGFVGKNPGSDMIAGTIDDRNYFNADYYTNNNLSVYSNVNENNSDFLEFINYQTLFGKDYFVILRPSLLIKNVTGIDILTNPYKTTYIQNYENLNLDGGSIKVYYDDNTSSIINMNASNVNVSNFNNSSVGIKTLTVNYKGKTATFNVEIVSKQATSIEVKTLPIKTSYLQNYEDLDLTGGIIKVTYNDNSTDELSMTNEEVTVNGFNNIQIGPKTLTVGYLGLHTEFNINVVQKSVMNIEIKKMPSKLTYIQNYEDLDLTGGIIKVTYNDNSIDEISMINPGISVNGFDNSSIGNKTLTVVYFSKTVTFNVEIVSKQVKTIEVKTLPTKTTYIQNYEDLDLTGGIIKVMYNDNSTDEISMTNEEVIVNGFSNSEIGNKTIVLKYKDKTITLTVEVITKQIVSIKVKKKPTNIDNINDINNFKFTDGILIVEYTDSSIDEISMSDENISIVKINNGKSIVVEYMGHQITINYNAPNEVNPYTGVTPYGVILFVIILISLVLFFFFTKKESRIKKI